MLCLQGPYIVHVTQALIRWFSDEANNLSHIFRFCIDFKYVFTESLCPKVRSVMFIISLLISADERPSCLLPLIPFSLRSTLKRNTTVQLCSAEHTHVNIGAEAVCRDRVRFSANERRCVWGRSLKKQHSNLCYHPECRHTFSTNRTPPYSMWAQQKHVNKSAIKPQDNAPSSAQQLYRLPWQWDQLHTHGLHFHFTFKWAPLWLGSHNVVWSSAALLRNFSD